jgi:hypothetical protein
MAFCQSLVPGNPTRHEAIAEEKIRMSRSRYLHDPGTLSLLWSR